MVCHSDNRGGGSVATTSADRFVGQVIVMCPVSTHIALCNSIAYVSEQKPASEVQWNGKPG
ncbi:hypothetical protein A6M23_12790 [Acidithiobacillus thiooxidans]|jgi:hypothetical protein|uniref:Uncharacterized protein n=1 Tax=Acidithiobacillus thiooxidans TaxID=930 RepID=A0A1C2J505_ACITH|nr:hypothetical protein A6M23_12790 [Acidithiobacillus thiooxidans]OCX83331.1 hypothetical protein A6P08_10635 [Acidithiobacillus thiooxidans]